MCVSLLICLKGESCSYIGEEKMNDKLLLKIRETAIHDIAEAKKSNCTCVELSMSRLPGTYMEQKMALVELEGKGVDVKEYNNYWTLSW